MGQVVVTPNECRTAASKLGLSYNGENKSKTKPAGCFFYGTRTLFNSETSPSMTNPRGIFGAVCRTGIISLLVYLFRGN